MFLQQSACFAPYIVGGYAQAAASLSLIFTCTTVRAATTTRRVLKTPLGRKIPFRLPQLGTNPTKAAAKQLKEAQRSAVSLVLLSAMGDVQRLVVAAIHRACAEWTASNTSSSSSGVTALQQNAAAAGHGKHGATSGATAAAGIKAAVAAGAAGCGGEAPGRLMPGCQAGAPSGVALAAGSGGIGVSETSVGRQVARFVAVSGQQVVLEVPSAAALPLLQCCSQQVGRDVGRLLGLQEGEQGDRGVQLPFRWWWGGSLDVLQSNTFTA